MRSEIIVPFRVVFVEDEMVVGFRHYAVLATKLGDHIDSADRLYVQFVKEPRNTKRFLAAVISRSKKSFEDLRPNARIHD